MAANALSEDVGDSQREAGGLAFRGDHYLYFPYRQHSKNE
jgi:hypothetical protein